MNNNSNTSAIVTMAMHYHHDAREFAQRFDFMRERQTSKTGRTKSFVDLIMGCESVLKAHILLGHKDIEPSAAYEHCRTPGHSIAKLADQATYCIDRTNYDFLKTQLSPFRVAIRYSLDTYGSLFPLCYERSGSDIDYSRTIGNTTWVSEIRACLELLLDAARPELTGFVAFDFSESIAVEKILTELLKPENQRSRKGGTSSEAKTEHHTISKK